MYNPKEVVKCLPKIGVFIFENFERKKRIVETTFPISNTKYIHE